MPKPARSTFGSYNLLYPLGRGGMGEVFLARQVGAEGIQRLVALKRILVHLSQREKTVQLFLDEVRIAALLAHGNIVQVIDHGVAEGQYFMAMEYVHGENLMEVLTRQRGRGAQVPLDLLLYIACRVCEGLDYAHTKLGLDGKPLGIVHRDISPQNILVSFQGEVKIADFGVARAAAQTHETLGGELKGKLLYMSPEQAWGREVDQRSDLFSLGVVLYEALSGESPFEREAPLATLEAVRAGAFRPLDDVRPDLPREVVEIVHRTLRPEAGERFDSARAVYEAVEQAMRLHGFVVSPFDLADFMRSSFPECRGRAADADAAGGTAIGRRADELVPGQAGGGVDGAVHETLFYLRQRHPELGGAPTDGAATWAAVPRRRLPLVLAALAIGLLGAGGLGLLIVGKREGGRPAPPGAALSEAAVTPAAIPDGGAASTVEPRRADARAVTGRGAGTVRAEGTLEVRSRPVGATVSVSGRRAGTTPLVARVAAGRQTVVVALRGHRPWRGEAEVRPGRSTPLEVSLDPLPALLTVESTASCGVSVDGREVGEAPVSARAVPAGSVLVVCERLMLGLRASRRVTLSPGEAVTVRFSFGVLAINLEPWAEVVVDGKGRGTTPLRLVLPAGVHRVELVNREKSLDRVLSVEIRGGATSRLSGW
jgi:eukaryotic-like serine/threonine-protein kinase